MTGKEIVQEIYEWIERTNLHPDDFDMLFAKELLEYLEQES
jgi:hypothetical protein